MRPASETELSEMIRAADGPLSVRGGGTRGCPSEGAPLETGGLAGIRLYEPGALTMVAGAGTPLADIEAALAGEGQMLPFEPHEMRDLTGATGNSTIGGVFATNASGARRVQCGAARDFLLGVRFVDGAGNIIKNGGRVMKNVTGYDLVKLMAGSFGTLGVLTEVSFKVLPRPETQATLILPAATAAEAVQAMARAMGSPYDVSGAAWFAGRGEICLRIEGFARSVAYRIEALRKHLGADGAAREEAAGPWEDLRRLRLFDQPPRALWAVGLRPSRVAHFLERLDHDGPFDTVLDWAGARMWIGSGDGDDARLEALHRALQGLAAEFGEGAHATLVRDATGTLAPRFQPRPEGVIRLEAGLRGKFDPRGILNRGLMG